MLVVTACFTQICDQLRLEFLNLSKHYFDKRREILLINWEKYFFINWDKYFWLTEKILLTNWGKYFWWTENLFLMNWEKYCWKGKGNGRWEAKEAKWQPLVEVVSSSRIFVAVLLAFLEIPRHSKRNSTLFHHLEKRCSAPCSRILYMSPRNSGNYFPALTFGATISKQHGSQSHWCGLSPIWVCDPRNWFSINSHDMVGSVVWCTSSVVKLG